MLNKVMRNFIKEGSTVIINKNSTYFGLTGEMGKVIDVIQNKLYVVDICGSNYPFTKDALNLK
jgi:DeoR/GlpR family transcriptional regulator of sugar metabolism